MIRFSTEGERFRELNEHKSYFLTEAEEVVQQLRSRLKNQKREVEPKRFGFYLNGQYLIDTKLVFSNPDSLENQIRHVMLEYTEEWDESFRQEKLKEFSELVKREKECFLNREFRVFAFLMRDTFEQKADWLFSLSQLEQLFQNVYAKLSGGFFSHVEDIVDSIYQSYLQIVDYYELLEGTHDEIQQAKANHFDNDEKFTEFTRFVTADYFSINRSNLLIYASKDPLYQSVQDYLFERKAVRDFQLALNIHSDIQRQLQKAWTESLMEGTSINRKEVVEWIIQKVLNQFLKKELEQENITEEEKAFCQSLLRIETRW